MLKILGKIRNGANKCLNFFITAKDHLSLRKLGNGDYKVQNSVKYHCQFPTPELTKNILEKKISVKDDPRWPEFGFSTVEECEFWSWRACAIICLKMVIETSYGSDEKVSDLIKEGVQLGGYISHDKNGKLVDKGWYYKPLINLAKNHGLSGKIFSPLSIQTICKEILNKHFIIASVNPEVIRYDKAESSYTGGHLVLVHGFRWKDGKCTGFYLHNPSGKSDDTRIAFIPIDVFKKAFAKKGFGLWK